ncbi:MAG: hypothetical protein PHI70_00845 [Proteiniphilum sp.]|nr:hypothetical protein [Proteiniphilum sp.]MDD4415326.1 hypothetical protein [Proteiniphilum sp.]
MKKYCFTAVLVFIAMTSIHGQSKTGMCDTPKTQYAEQYSDMILMLKLWDSKE